MRVQGTIRVPGDKSISHRALMLSAVATGTSRIRGILQSADVQSTAAVLRGLGAALPPLSGDFKIRGVGFDGLRASSLPLDCGNSGTTARLMAGVAAAQSFRSTFVGDSSLSRRPMRRIAKPLTEMGARVDLPQNGGLPMTVQGGALHAIEYFSETSSAQVKSGVLLAACIGRVGVSVIEPLASRDHTERMLSARGVQVQTMVIDRGHEIRLEPIQSLPGCDVDVPADPSSAAFFAGLGALARTGSIALREVCMNPTRSGAFAVLSRMGARIEISDRAERGGEPTATVTVRPGPLAATTIGGAEIPALIDELPLIACVAARASGETVITGAGELRVKESDRIAAIVSNLRAVGAQAEELPDGLRVIGGSAPLGGRVTTHGDHRIAMAFGILGAITGSPIQVDDRECVSVSYPGFWNDLASAVTR
ncbi:MAG TPA: 3-phosphoshikimate 1-carboxyvinyltransferase [Gemmatimonadaceae bacterium]